MIQKILGTNWLPKLFGFIALIAGVISQSPSILAHAIPANWIPGVTAWAGILTAISGAFFIGSVKAHNVTGGTVAATPEAAERIAAPDDHLPNYTAAKMAIGALLVLVFLPACASTSGGGGATRPAVTVWVPSSTELALIQTGAQVATGAALQFGISNTAQRTTIANDIYASSAALDSLAGGTVPTASQLQSTVLAFGGSAPTAQYVAYASDLSALYSSYYAKIQGNPKAAVQVLEALSAGINTGAAAYISVTAAE